MFRSVLLAVLLAIDVGLFASSHGQQIESPAMLSKIRALLPRIDDLDLQAILNDGATIWYTHETMGIGYQNGSSRNGAANPVTFADGMYNNSGESPEGDLPNGQGGNANTFRSFPWIPRPGGAHLSPNTDSFKGFWLPKQDDGAPWPVVTYRHQIEGVFNPRRFVRGTNWTFPVGTVFVEALVLKNPNNGENYVYELRFRIREHSEWGVELFRPFPTAEKLAAAIQSHRPAERSLLRIVEHLQGPGNVKTILVRTNRATGNRAFGTRRFESFHVRSSHDVLPKMDAALVGELLDNTVFTSALGETWKPGVKGCTTDEDFHTVPKGYLGAIVGTDRVSCARCHESTLDSSRRHNANNGRYGWVRGNLGRRDRGGGILSWHPIQPRSFRGRNRSNGVQFRKLWRDTGITAKMKKEDHPPSMYVRLVSDELQQAETEFRNRRRR